MTIISTPLLLLFLNQIVTNNGATECGQAFQCANETSGMIQDGSDSVICSGYKSCSSNDLVSGEGSIYGVDCTGAYSCHKITTITTGTDSGVWCRGDHSCVRSNMYAPGSSFNADVVCAGVGACADSAMNVSDTGQVICYGDQSCYESEIFTSDIIADGAYSLNFATITSILSGDSTFTISLGGYFAGYGARIVCRSQEGIDCTVTCYGNACYNLDFVCDTGSGSACNVVCDDSQSIPCPNGWNSTDLEALDDQIEYNYEILLDTNTISQTNDVICAQDSSDYCSDSLQCFEGNSSTFDSDNAICCRGSESCRDAEITETRNDLISCGGHMSCEGNDPVNSGVGDTYNGSIYCFGATSCRYSYLTANDTIVCSGYEACSNAKIYNAKNLWCTGGYQSCRSADIYAVENIYVLGYNFIMHVAEIFSDGVGLMNVYLRGGDSGKNLDIYCEENDWCYIECGVNSACTSLELFCTGNCLIYCNESIGINCPTGLTGNYTFVARGDNSIPTQQPTQLPTIQPTQPSFQPSFEPSFEPTSDPTALPTSQTTIDTTVATTEETTEESAQTAEETQMTTTTADSGDTGGNEVEIPSNDATTTEMPVITTTETNVAEGNDEDDGDKDKKDNNSHFELIVIIVIVTAVALGIIIVLSRFLMSRKKSALEMSKNLTSASATTSPAAIDTVEMKPTVSTGLTPGNISIINNQTPGGTIDTNAADTDTNTIDVGAHAMATNYKQTSVELEHMAPPGDMNKGVSTSTIQSQDSLEQMWDNSKNIDFATDGGTGTGTAVGATADTVGPLQYAINSTNGGGGTRTSGTKTGGSRTSNTTIGRTSGATGGNRSKNSVQDMEREGGEIEGDNDNYKEKFLEQWSVKDVNEWLEEKLAMANIEKVLVDAFMNEWNTQHITGPVLKIYKNDMNALQEVKQDLAQSNLQGLNAMWAVVRSEISKL